MTLPPSPLPQKNYAYCANSAAIFVYGTLMRGHLRSDQWPRHPVTVQPAWTRGALWDLGPYPCLIDGPDRVAGEAWLFHPADWEPTLHVLDAIEGCAGRPEDLYRRQTKELELLTVRPLSLAEESLAGQTSGSPGEDQQPPEPTRLWGDVYLYFASLPSLARRISPAADGFARWSKTAAQEG